MSSTSWREQVSIAANDRTSGAQGIAGAVAEAVQAYLEQQGSVPIGTLLDDLRGIASEVLQGQPSMAPVLRIVNDVLYAAGTDDNWRGASEAIRSACVDFVEAASRAEEKIAHAAAQILPASGTLVTLSFSSAVLHVLRLAAARGTELRVICLESRPAFEGRRLAAELSDAGLRTTIMIDAASYDALEDADLWLCGADSLTAEGVVNKTGTAALSMLAQSLECPGYVLANTHKIWPAALGTPPVVAQDAEEVWPDPPDGVHVVNRYFDLAPWGGFRAVVTERGPMRPAEIGAYSQAIRVHPFVREIMIGDK